MQLDIFNYECQTPYRVKKPIRLIELFAGNSIVVQVLEHIFEMILKEDKQ